MKTPKEQADELVEKFRDYVWVDYRHDEEPSYSCMVQCAIKAVEHTIEVLENVKKGIDDWGNHLKHIINEQTEILTELKAKL